MKEYWDKGIDIWDMGKVTIYWLLNLYLPAADAAPHLSRDMPAMMPPA